MCGKMAHYFNQSPPPESEIPEHTGCTGCGSCCTANVPLSETETRRIDSYVRGADADKFAYILEVLFAEKDPTPHGRTACPFRDNVLGRCAIYEVRPVTCRVWGVSDDSRCDNGNSAFMDCSPWTDPVAKEIHVSNKMTTTRLLGKAIVDETLRRFNML